MQRTSTPYSMRFAKIITLISLGIFILMAVFFLVVEKSFWLDEAATGIHVLDSWANMLDNSLNMAHAPVYYFLLKLWCTLFGYSDSVIALFSLVLFIGALWIFYRLCLLLFQQKDIAFMGVLLTLSHSSLIYHAVEAKQYIWLFFLSCIVLYLFITMLKQYTKRTLVWFLFWNLLGIYSHPWFLVFFGTLLLWVYYRLFAVHKTTLLQLFSFSIIILVLIFPALLLYWKFSLAGAASWIGDWAPMARYKDAARFLMGNTLNFAIYFLIIALSFAWGVRNMHNQYKQHKLELNYLTLVIGTAIGVSLILDLQIEMVVGRYFIPLIPIVLLFVLAFLAAIPQKRRLVNIAVFLLLFFTIPLQFYTYMQNPAHIRLKEEITELKQILRPSDVVVVTNFSYAQYCYYMQTLPGIKIPVYSLPASLEKHPGYMKQYDQRFLPESEYRRIFQRIEKKSKSRVFLVMDNEGAQSFTGRIPLVFGEKYDFSRSWEWTSVIYLYHMQG